MMKPNVWKWHDILEPYRAEAWADCVRLVRAHVDQDPYDLSTRALLASLLLRTRQPAMALMQYERLLPLAVGQANLFRAIATQRRLDELHLSHEKHPDRYRAIQDWFRGFAATRLRDNRPVKATGGIDAFPVQALLALSPEALTMIAEEAILFPLEMAPHVLNEPGGVFWVVYFGRIRWAIVGAADSDRTERTAEEGDVIYLPAGSPSERRLEVVPETPSEVMQFDPGLAVLMGRASEPSSERSEA